MRITLRSVCSHQLRAGGEEFRRSKKASQVEEHVWSHRGILRTLVKSNTIHIMGCSVRQFFIFQAGEQSVNAAVSESVCCQKPPPFVRRAKASLILFRANPRGDQINLGRRRYN